jgi:predicted enzyme related to lactoylglutathione lyase
MNKDATKTTAAIAWVDLTVPDAGSVRDFYKAVVGWTDSAVEMDGYHDFCMNEPGSGRAVAGVCHARGVNAHLPPRWLIYINVEHLDASLAACAERGGRMIGTVRQMGTAGRYCVIEDPAGAVAALFEPAC